MMKKSDTHPLSLGVDYYPEHWPETRWPRDVELMREAGLTVVRLGEFSWAKMEPSRGAFDFEWLERAVNLLGRAGMRVVLGTPTAAPPAWLIAAHPDILPVDAQGRRHHFGTRIHRCMSNPRMREASAAITRAMVQRFANNPHVIAWQTDNELGSNPARWYCEHCAAGFREWLKIKYGDLAALNEAWFTPFWSQDYTDWEQVDLPRHTVYGGTAHNPSRVLDYYRFASDVIVKFQREQIAIMRALAPHQQVTHNLMGLYCLDFDHYELARDIDFVAWDNYPTISHALDHDVMRGIKRRNFWVMEQKSGPAGWQTMGPTPKPGQIRLWTYQSIAHGADTVVYFRWRSCLGGTEQFWHGILNHDGVPRRRYREIREIGGEIARLAPLLAGTSVWNEVAIVNSYDQIWAYQIQPQCSGGLDYWKLARPFHEALGRAGVGTDVIGLHDDFSSYRLIIFPSLYLLDETLARKIAVYVEAGGHVLLMPRTGVKDWNNRAWDLPLPGWLRECAGIELDEYDAIGDQATNHLRMTGGGKYLVSRWCDVIEPHGAEVLATYEEDFYAGRPAFTRHAYGRGVTWYLGTLPEAPFHDDLVKRWIDELALTSYPGLPSGVDAKWRTDGRRRVLFLLNFTDEAKQVPRPAGIMPVIPADADPACAGTLTLPPWGVGVLAEGVPNLKSCSS